MMCISDNTITYSLNIKEYTDDCQLTVGLDVGFDVGLDDGALDGADYRKVER